MPKKAPAVAKSTYFTPGERCVERVDNKVVSFRVAKVLATGSGYCAEEIILTKKGTIIYGDDLEHDRKFTSFKDIDAVKAFLRKDLDYKSTQALYEQLGGSIEKDIQEI